MSSECDYDGFELLSIKSSRESNKHKPTPFALQRRAISKKQSLARKYQRFCKESKHSDERKVPLKDATKKANKKVVVKAQTDDKALAKAKAKSQAKAKSKEKVQSEKKDQSQSQKKAQAHAHKK